MSYRTKADSARRRELMEEITKHGRVGGFEDDGRQYLDPRPMAARPKVRVQNSPLEQMYAEIRAKEAAARDAQYQESDEEQHDFDLPEDMEELISQYEEIVQPDVSVLGEAIRDPRVYSAVQAALEDRYGPLEAEALAKYREERESALEGREAQGGQQKSAVQPSPSDPPAISVEAPAPKPK